MSPRTEKQFAEIREERKEQIMHNALFLFADQGYHNTSISQVAQKTGISKGLIYNYFTGKEDLLRSLVISGFDEYMQYFDPNHDGVLEKGELHYLIRKMFSLLKEKMSIWKLYFGILFQEEVMKLVEEEVVEYFLPYMNLLVQYFENEGKKNPYVEARFFVAMLDGIAMHYMVDPDHYPLEESMQKLIEQYT